jgi:hypothetical protein
MPDFLNLSWLFGKGTRRRKHRIHSVAIDSESGLEHYKSGGPNSNVEVRRNPTSRSQSASEKQRRNKKIMALSERDEGFANIVVDAEAARGVRKTRKQMNQKRSRKKRNQRQRQSRNH